MISFLAPFNQSYRTQLFQKWTKEIAARDILIAKDLDFNSQFGDPIVTKKWIENDLPNDDYSI